MIRSFAALLGLLAVAGLAVPADKAPEYNPGPIKGDEPVAKGFSMAKAGQYLDHAGSKWTSNRKCVTCHTNASMLWAKPALGGKASAEEQAVRAFFEGRAKNWDRGGKGDKPRSDADVVVTAGTLAVHDAKTTGKLNATTRAALDRMWTIQKPTGEWDWIKCNWPPQEHDDYFGAVFAAVGVGIAPDGYAATEKAKAGLEKLRAYLKKTPAPTLHHKAWLLWAATKVEGLMTKDEREKTVKELRDLQKADGGWSLPSLGDWKGFDGRENNTKAASDGYGTGLVVLILRQAGVPAKDPAIEKGVKWLKANQRESGRWFTQSLNTDRAHYISNAGTAYALMALAECK
jgi:squalene-hopene/tetraprenyl-beta-curcumene cyclase